MFDAKQLLEAIMNGANQAGGQQNPSATGRGDMRYGAAEGQASGGFDTGAGSGVSSGGETGGLADMMGQVLGKLQDGAARANDASGGLGSKARDIFGQATDGVREGAGQLNSATGAGTALDNMVRQLSGGQGAGDLVTRAKEMMGNNPGATGALAGILGGLLLGTKTGRGLAVDAAKLGGLVLIGGLAYKAYQNHSAGRPLIASSQDTAAPAPSGSGFEANAQGNSDALLYIQAMIAAAAADGHIDETERKHILGGIEQAGLSGPELEFLQHEFGNPASVASLAEMATTPEVAAQVFTAARLTVDADNYAEKGFLSDLARALGIDPQLAAHIDAEVRSVRG